MSWFSSILFCEYNKLANCSAFSGVIEFRYFNVSVFASVGSKLKNWRNSAILPVAKQYNNAYILVEINDIGGQVADVLHQEYEYENLLVTSIRGRKGQTLDGGFGKAEQQRGIRTTKAVKKLGCSVLKSMVEGDKLLIHDYDTIRELVSFISRHNSFEAEANYNDKNRLYQELNFNK